MSCARRTGERHLTTKILTTHPVAYIQYNSTRNEKMVSGFVLVTL